MLNHLAGFDEESDRLQDLELLDPGLHEHPQVVCHALCSFRVKGLVYHQPLDEAETQLDDLCLLGLTTLDQRIQDLIAENVEICIACLRPRTASRCRSDL